MAYTPLDCDELIAGKPIKEEFFDQLKVNQDSFHTDIELLKQSATFDIYNIRFGGSISQYDFDAISGRIPTFRSPVDGSFVQFKVTLLEPSTSGTLEITFETSNDDGVNWAPLLNNPVVVSGTTAGSLNGPVDWIGVASQTITQDQLFRIRVLATQEDQGDFHIHIYGELS